MTTVSIYRNSLFIIFLYLIALTTPTLHVLILVLLWDRIFSRLINIHWIIDEYRTLNCWSGGMTVPWCNLIPLSLAGIQCNRDGWSWPYLRKINIYWIKDEHSTSNSWSEEVTVLRCNLIRLSLAGIQWNRDGWSWPFLRLYWSPKKKRSVKRYRKHMQVVKLKYNFFILNYSF